ncbi:MAG TPA: hypothetical protein DCP20_06545 [Coriobacteriia bacterium]|nr:hypothetical protein [Coriobacteriia bacterium]
MTRHAWSESDDVAALYLYRFGERPPIATIAGVAKASGMTEASLRMRMGNFKAIDLGSGLDNWAKQSESVFRRYADASEEELFRIAFGGVE